MIRLHSSEWRCSSKGTCIIQSKKVHWILFLNCLLSVLSGITFDKTITLESLYHTYCTQKQTDSGPTTHPSPHQPPLAAYSGNIVILVGIVLVSFHIVTVNQRLNSFLEIWWLDWKFELVIKFSEKQVMTQGLPHLHDPDNGSIDLVLSVLEDSFLSGLLFIIGLF